MRHGERSERNRPQIGSFPGADPELTEVAVVARDTARSMSPETLVRLPVRIAGRLPRRRRLDEKILFRVPRLVWLISALVLRLPYGSFVRRRILLFLVRRAYVAVDRGDLDLVRVLMYHPGAELSFVGKFADFDQSYRGREAAFAAYSAWIDSWEDYRREPREVIDLGDRVLILLRESGRGKGSGVPVEAHLAMLLTFRSGRVVKHQEFSDWRQALEAVGLREQPAS
jgi:ketosteroid isomerase-like protein